MAYVWFVKSAEGTYVDYTSGMDEDIAYPIRDIGDNRVVGVFVTDLAAALRKAKELDEKRRQEMALGLLVQARWLDASKEADCRLANSAPA